MNKLKYEKLTVEIITLPVTDVLTASEDNNDGAIDFGKQEGWES